MAATAPAAAAAGGSAAASGSPNERSATTTAPATFYTVVGGGNDTYWRVQVPARALGAKTCVVHGDYYGVFQAQQDSGPFPWSATKEGDFTYPAHEGAAVWTRPDLHRARHMFAMQDCGILTLAEVDDNYLSDPNLSLFMRMNHYGAEGRADHLKAMAVADRVVCSTEWLRDEYHRAFKRELGVVPELHVCRNHTLLEDWPEPIPPRADGRLRIGWMGSPQHVRDVKLAFRAFAWARQQGHEIVFMGDDVRDETGVTHPRALEACRAWRSVITRHVPWQNPEDYHRSALPLDIGIVPLEYNTHTLGKSDVKAIEYAVSGAVPLLQNHPVYAKEWRHNETCLLAGSPAEFEHQLKALCESRSLRERLVAVARQYVREERSDKQLRKEWGEAVAS